MPLFRHHAACAAAALILAGGSSGLAGAQASFQPNWAGWGAANLGMNALAHQQATPDVRGVRRSAPPPGRTSAPTSYRRDPAVTRRVVDSFADYVAGAGGASQGQAVREQLARTDLERAWAELAGHDGFRAGDASDALAAYWMLNWIMANHADAEAPQAAGVRAQVRVALSASPAFARLSEAQRQAMAETYMVNFLYQQGSYTGALRRGDQGMLRRLSDAAQQRFHTEMKVDLRALALTDHGFAPRG